MTGVSRVTWWRWTRKGMVLKPVRLGTTLIGWRMSELQVWIAEREAVRRISKLFWLTLTRVGG